MNPPGESLGLLFARRLGAAPGSALETACTELLHALEKGDSCLPPPEERAARQEREALRTHPAIGAPGEATPLILDADGALYLYRYRAAEEAVAQTLRRHAEAPLLLTETETGSALEKAAGALAYTPSAEQTAAVRIALQHPLALVTGGPGTGKTTVVALLLHALEATGATPDGIALAAPTGKAAARLQESLGPSAPKATTLHRLLGLHPGRDRPRYHEEHRLAVHTLVLDEASMVDLPLFARLCRALPPAARLVLLGDSDQLASVEAGVVFAEAVRAAEAGGPLAPCLQRLSTAFRFGPADTLGEVLQAVRAGEGEAAWALLQEAGAVEVRELPETSGLPALATELAEPFRAVMAAGNPAEGLRKLGARRVLTPLRRGPWGSLAWSARLRAILAPSRAGAEPFAGLPLLVQRNDAATGLSNGEAVLLWPGDGGELRAWASGPEGLRALLPAQLPETEPAWASTVHKAQGSEFDRVDLLLPPEDSPVLSRELVYTALSRARSGLRLWADKTVFLAAVARPTRRASGLFRHLTEN